MLISVDTLGNHKSGIKAHAQILLRARWGLVPESTEEVLGLDTEFICNLITLAVTVNHGKSYTIILEHLVQLNWNSVQSLILRHKKFLNTQHANERRLKKWWPEDLIN
jgi:hypothetical protein